MSRFPSEIKQKRKGKNMRKNAFTLLRSLCVLLMLALVLASCQGGGGKIEDTTDTDTETETEPQAPLSCTLADFQIIRSDVASSDVTEAIVALNRTIKESTGKSLAYKTDLLEKDETAFEILIGNTAREESVTVAESLSTGEYAIQTVRTEEGAKLVIVGYNDTLTLEAIEAFSTMVLENTVEENGLMKSFSLKVNLYDRYSDFTLNVGDPILVTQGDTYSELGWGPYQFPNLYYTTNGSIICRWSNHNDKIYGGTTFNIPTSAVSDDGGLTWREKTNDDVISHESRSLMSNGKYFAGFSSKNSYVFDGITQYRSLMTTHEGKNLYPASAIKELDLTYYASEYDPRTGKTTKFECTVNWPDQLISVYPGNIVHPPQREFALAGGLGDLAVGDKLYYCIYARGYDPETGKIGKYSGYFSTFVFCSEDNARTWNLVSQVYLTDEVFEESKNHTGDLEGFGEAKMSLMPDGSIVMLMRTGGNQPCYLVRSTDGCKTWSEPVKFDEVGVRPFIVTLECGVSLASYGRDGLFVRATSDPSGLEWQDHIELKFNRFGNTAKSCYYTYILPLSVDTALLVYTDFYYTPTGLPADVGKSVMVRILTVEPKT